jgi:hypothetical protein
VVREVRRAPLLPCYVEEALRIPKRPKRENPVIVTGFLSKLVKLTVKRGAEPIPFKRFEETSRRNFQVPKEVEKAVLHKKKEGARKAHLAK